MQSLLFFRALSLFLWLVHTDYDADFWLQPMTAGFRKIRLFILGGPEAIAVVCGK